MYLFGTQFNICLLLECLSTCTMLCRKCDWRRQGKRLYCNRPCYVGWDTGCHLFFLGFELPSPHCSLRSSFVDKEKFSFFGLLSLLRWALLHGRVDLSSISEYQAADWQELLEAAGSWKSGWGSWLGSSSRYSLVAWGHPAATQGAEVIQTL